MSEAAVTQIHNLPGPVPVAPSTGSEPWMDVWSRSGSKYRLRAVLLLAVNVLLFAGAGTFAYWLRNGEFFAPGREGYAQSVWQTIRGVGQAEVSLGSLLIGPISVQHVPMLIPILGLLMAALVSIPILVSILYRFWSSVPFIAVVGFLAVMPWLAITLLGSCVLASVRPFRTRFRFMSALLGLVPVIVYLALAWNGTREVMVGRIDPVDAFKFVAPWVLAIVASAAVFAVVLALARLVNYRPGAVTPLLAVMFALPVVMFENYVGRDELYYRLLEQLDAAYFTDVPATTDWLTAARREWERHPPPRPPFEVIRAKAEQRWMFQLNDPSLPFQTELTQHQSEIIERCHDFHRNYPDSRYTPNALFIMARAQDRRVDIEEFRSTKWIRFYDDFPSQASAEAWNMVWENRPRSPMAAVAGLRLAQLDARRGDVLRAIRRLSELLDRFPFPAVSGPEYGDAGSQTAQPGSALAAEASLRIPLDRILFEAHRLYGLLVQNNDPLYGYEPISGPKRGKAGEPWFGMLDIDPRGGHYVEQLRRLVQAYPRCQIEDNVELEAAKSAAAREDRIARLEALLKRFGSRDATAEAMLHLAGEYEGAGRHDLSQETLERLARHSPNSYWTKAALQFTQAIPQVSLAGSAAP